MAKEVITFETPEQDEAKKWSAQKIAEGYQVTILFDEDSGIYTCIAIK